MYKVLLVDDEYMILNGLKKLLIGPVLDLKS